MSDQRLIDYLIDFISPKRNERFDLVLAQRTKHFTVAIEDVYQLHNTSAVIRSCDVFGIQEVNVIEEVNRKKIDREIAMGAQKWVDVNRYHTSKECIKNLKNQGYRIIATTPHKKDCDIEDFDFTQKSCFFFGSEQEGLSDEVNNSADSFINIPMVGFTESLNVSVSAAIILQNITNKLRRSDLDWQLTNEEMLDIKLRWIQKTLKSYDDIVSRYESKNY